MTGRGIGFMPFFALVFMNFAFVLVRPGDSISCCFRFFFLLISLLFAIHFFSLFSFRFVPLLIIAREEGR